MRSSLSGTFWRSSTGADPRSHCHRSLPSVSVIAISHHQEQLPLQRYEGPWFVVRVSARPTRRSSDVPGSRGSVVEDATTPGRGIRTRSRLCRPGARPTLPLQVPAHSPRRGDGRSEVRGYINNRTQVSRGLPHRRQFQGGPGRPPSDGSPEPPGAWRLGRAALGTSEDVHREAHRLLSRPGVQCDLTDDAARRSRRSALRAPRAQRGGP